MNEKFIEIIREISEKKRIKKKAISELAGIAYNRINNIQRGTTPAKELDFIKLDRAFPDLGILDKEEKGNDDISNEDIIIDRINPLERRVQQLEKENREMKRKILDKLDQLTAEQKKVLEDMLGQE